MVFKILALASTLIAITLLRRMVNIFPSLLTCLLRWKENVNLEASVKNSYDRNMIAIAMIIPFCLTAEEFGLYTPRFMEGMNENFRIGATVGVFAVYCLIRMFAAMVMKPQRNKIKTYETAGRTAYTFFIVLTLLLVAIGGVMTFINIETAVIRSAMLWVSAFIYALLLLRKIQIFASGFSIFAGFLYLCALEILPTGLLIASAVIF